MVAGAITVEKISKEATIHAGMEQQASVTRQHKLGKKTAQERLNFLLDPESFQEIDHLAKSVFLVEKFCTDGVIAGFGKIDGKQVAVYAQDFTIKGGSLGKRHAEKPQPQCDISYAAPGDDI